jgi:hypothetical protein
MSSTLNELVRDSILDGGPHINFEEERTRYVDGVLNGMNNVQLLECISNALYQVTEGLSVRLGL